MVMSLTKAEKNLTSWRSRVRSDRLRAQRSAKLSVDFSFGDVNNQNLDVHDMRWREATDDVKEAFKQARRWHRQNWFIREVVRAKFGFFNYGFTLKAANPKQQAKLDAWSGPKGAGQLLRRYVRDTVMEWLIQDTVITFWRDSEAPYHFLPETVKYTDAMGVEKLWVSLSYKKKDLEAAEGDDTKFSPEEVQRYSSNQILIGDPKYPAARLEHFRVLTNGTRGQGLAWPSMYAAFRTLTQGESMEVGEAQLAMAGRMVIEQHQIGFEVKSASLAHKQANFLWDKKRAEDLMAFFNGSGRGLVRICSQFDHNIKFVWLDPKLFDAEKWNTIVNRLIWWAGPVGFMMLAKQDAPYLLPMLKAQMESDRAEFVGPHLEEVISVWSGVDCRVSWGSRIFTDPKLAWDRAKFLTAQGPLSLKTALQQADYDPDTEAENKKDEAKKTRKDELLPLYDASHGVSPGEAPEGAGRPKGSKTGTGEAP